jgi:hypothetical protein
MTLKHRIIATGSKYIPYEVNKDFVVREITSENDIQQTAVEVLCGFVDICLAQSIADFDPGLQNGQPILNFVH